MGRLIQIQKRYRATWILVPLMSWILLPACHKDPIREDLKEQQKSTAALQEQQQADLEKLAKDQTELQMIHRRSFEMAQEVAANPANARDALKGERERYQDRLNALEKEFQEFQSKASLNQTEYQNIMNLLGEARLDLRYIEAEQPVEAMSERLRRFMRSRNEQKNSGVVPPRVPTPSAPAYPTSKTPR